MNSISSNLANNTQGGTGTPSSDSTNQTLSSSFASDNQTSLSSVISSTSLSTSPLDFGHETTTSTGNKDGLTGGKVAGVVVGMLIAGFLIAGAVFLFLLRRQKRQQAASYQMHRFSPNHYTSVPEKGPIVVGSAVPRTTDDLLPQPLPDDALTDEVSRIRDNIKNHVLTYYHSAPISATLINEAGLQGVSAAAGMSSSALVGRLSSPSTRQDALRLIVGWVVLSKCAGERNTSLLPLELARLVNSIPDRDGSDTTQVALYSKWKTMTGVLLQRQFGKNAQDPNRVQIFGNIITELDSILAPFIEGDANGGQRRKNLDMILTRSANFAFLLFSQPGSFQFDFASRHGGLVVFPALLQLIGDQGQMLSPPRVLMEKEVVAA